MRNRLANPRFQCDRDAHPQCHREPDCDAHRNGDSDGQPDIQRHADADADAGAHGQLHSYRQQHPRAQCDHHGHGHADSQCDADGDRHHGAGIDSDEHSNRQSGSQRDAIENGDRDEHGHRKRKPDGVTDRERYLHGDAQRNAKPILHVHFDRNGASQHDPHADAERDIDPDRRAVAQPDPRGDRSEQRQRDGHPHGESGGHGNAGAFLVDDTDLLEHFRACCDAHGRSNGDHHPIGDAARHRRPAVDADCNCIGDVDSDCLRR
jgi:hypothetical protein